MKSKYDILNLVQDKETKMQVAKIYDTYTTASEYDVFSCTSFLSPNMVSFVIENFNDNNIEVKLFGGYENAERVVLGFNPKNNEFIDYNIEVLKMTYNKKYSRELKHSDFLGSLMGLSIKRELIGDIIIEEECAYVFVCDTISNFIIENLKKIGRTNINIEKFKEDVQFLVKEQEEFKTTVSSLRCDVVLAKVFNLSRGEVKELFDSGKVFINWVNIFDIAKLIKENDVVTLRGFGRIKYLGSNGINKKAKISISYLKY